MTEILIVSKNYKESVEWFKYLYECLRTDNNFHSAVYACNIWVGDFFIKLCVNDDSRYRGISLPILFMILEGICPNYHYCNGLEELEFYLLSRGSKSLPDLASVVELVKKGEDK